MCLGGIGVTGTLAANTIALKADVVIAVGTRLGDFATSSKWQFQNPDVKVVSVNNNRYHAEKMDAITAVGDAKVTLEALGAKLRKKGYKSAYVNEVKDAKAAWDAEMKRLAGYVYGEGFEPMVKARDPRTVPQFVELYGSTLTQAAAICAVRESIGENDNIITAGGSLPSCLQRIWTTDKRGGYHAEYGYSCMGYEVAASLGVKLAQPESDVWAFVGDGSFQMLHSEIMTIIQEGAKVNILVFDNCGFGCINNLQMNNGVFSLATEFRKRDANGKLLGDLIPVNYAKLAEGYGVKGYTVRTLEELKAAIADAKKQAGPVLIDLKIIPKTMTDGYESWWNVCAVEHGGSEDVRKAAQTTLEERKKARLY